MSNVLQNTGGLTLKDRGAPPWGSKALPSDAFDLIGVNYPTAALPGLLATPTVIPIMPVIPDGAYYVSHDWHTDSANSYDPVLITTPTPTGAADEYVISYTGDDGTAGNGGKGTLALPRDSLPTGTFPAGTKLFLVGSDTAIPATYGVNQEIGFTQWQASDFAGVVFEGTTANPCWVVGIDLPRVRTRAMKLNNSDHLLFDGVVLTASESSSYRGSITLDNCNYVTFRNGAQLGVNSDLGQSFFAVSDSSFIMYYNNIQRFGGLWDGIGSAIKDWHGFRPLYGNRYLWCIDSHFSYISGDGCQPGNSNYGGLQSAVSHFLYFSGNTGTKIREQLFDAKSSYHCIVTENHTFAMLQGGVAANAGHITIAQDNEGTGGGSDNFFLSHNWAIANTCDGSGSAETQSGIANKNNATNGTGAPNGGLVRKTFIIGNVIYNMTGTGIAVRTSASSDGDSEVWVCYNTLYNITGNVFYTNMWQPEPDTADHYIDANVALEFDAKVAGLASSPNYFNQYSTENYAYRAAGAPYTWDTSTVGSADDNLGTDPELTDPGNNDFRPASGSPVLNSTTEPACIQLFEDIYGISIRKDYLGAARPSIPTGWSAGAVQDAA